MTDITVNPCEDESPGGDDGTGAGSNSGGTSEDTSRPIVFNRISFPEKVITAPVPQSERLVTIMNSVHFFENNMMYQDASQIEMGSYPIRPIASDASTVFEIPRERLVEAGYRDNAGSILVAQEVGGADDLFGFRPIEQALEIAKSKGLVSPDLTFTDLLEQTRDANSSVQELVDFIGSIRSAASINIEPIRFATGLVFTNSPVDKSIVIANGNQFAQAHSNASRTASNEFPAAEQNMLKFGCPFYLARPKDERLIPAGSGTDMQFLQLLGASALKTETRDVKFYTNIISTYAENFLKNFKGQNDHEKVQNFADIYVNGPNYYRGDGSGRNENILDQKTYLSRSEIKNILPQPLFSSDRPYVDITFEAPQAFFREETDYVALGKQLIADINVYVGSTELDDGSVIKDYSESTSDELKKKNFYRTYSGRTLTKSQVDAQEAGKVVKFSSRNVDQFRNINEDQKNLFSKHVNITIENQKATASGVSSILKQFDMEKYIIEMMSDTNGLRTLDELNLASAERLTMFLDQHYDLNTTSTEIESYYSQYLQPGENIEEVKERINSVLDNFNQDSFKKNILQTVWTSYGDDLSMLKLKLPEGHPLRQQLLPDSANNPGLYGSENGVVNPLEWPLGFHESLPPTLGVSEEENGPTDAWRFDELKYAVCSAKLKQYLEPKGFRSYQDILEGKKCYSEVIGYKVKKFIVNQTDGSVSPEPIQEFYMMGTGTDNIVDFVDSQVIFEKKYKYEISSINFVVGNIYFFDFSRQGTPRSSGRLRRVEYEMTTATFPMWSIVEAPLFSRIVHIVDKPPLAPQVSFLPYMGHDNKIKLLLQSNFGRLKQKPIKVLESDEEVISKMRQAQEIDIASGKLEYANDSLPTQFQMIRMDTPPKKYSDFGESGKVITVNTSGRAGAIEDEIQPNKDYYYIFRALDARGISNPGFVYKMRMVSYENGIYMDLKEYDMSKKQDQVTIPFRKFLQIEPSNLNRTINFGNADVTSAEFMNSAPDNVSLGNDPDNSIWNRKFKIRIKSKSSSRKIDLIVKFKQKSEQIQSPVQASETSSVEGTSNDGFANVGIGPPGDY